MRSKQRVLETFIVGETVGLGKGPGFPRKEVKVISVDGNQVAVIDSLGRELHFKPRNTDWKYVPLGADVFAVMPMRIYHFKPNSQWKQLIGTRFSKLVRAS